MEKISYTPHGVCSRRIDVTLQGDTVVEISFVGGCSGNTQGLAALAKGRSIDDIIARVEGIRCGFKATSCPDQLAKALHAAKKAAAKD